MEKKTYEYEYNKICLNFTKDKKSQEAYQFMHRLGSKKTFFVVLLIEEYLNSHSIINADTLSKREIKAIVNDLIFNGVKQRNSNSNTELLLTELLKQVNIQPPQIGVSRTMESLESNLGFVKENELERDDKDDIENFTEDMEEFTLDMDNKTGQNKENNVKTKEALKMFNCI